MNRATRYVTDRILGYLKKPSVRYRYLPKLHEITHYTRKEEILRTCLEYLHLADVKGDYLEFGMWKGGSMIAAYHLSKHFASHGDMRFYGFDSFQGLPTAIANPQENDLFLPGSFSAGFNEVKGNLVEGGVDMSRVELIPGWYSDTLNQQTREKLQIKAAALVNVDCDLYESTVWVLEFVERYLRDGSIIIFDDWYCFANRADMGEQKAFTEWLERNRHLQATPYKEFGWDGKAFIINHVPNLAKSTAMHESLESDEPPHNWSTTVR